MATRFAIKTVYEGVDKTSQVFKDMEKNGKRAARKTQSAFTKAGRRIGTAFKDLARHTAMAGIGLAVLATKKAVSAFLDFESEMLNVKAITKSTDEQYKLMSKSALEMAKTSVFTSAEVAQGMKYLGIAGWKTSKIIAGMPGLLQLAAATQTDLALTSDILSDSMTAFKIPAEQATHVADVFAGVATSTNTTVEQLGEAMKDAAPAAQVWGTSIEETSAILGTMANNAIKGGRAGTSFKNIVLNLAKPSKEASKWLRKMNVEIADDKGNFRKLSDVLADVTKGMEGLTQRQKAAATNAIFKKRAFAGVTAIISQQKGKVDELTEAFTNNTNVAKDMAETQLSGASGALKKLTAAFDAQSVIIMQKYGPAMEMVMNYWTDVISGVDKLENMNKKNLAIGVDTTLMTKDSFDTDKMLNARFRAYKKYRSKMGISAADEKYERTFRGGGGLKQVKDYYNILQKGKDDRVNKAILQPASNKTSSFGSKDEFTPTEYKSSKPVETVETVKNKVESKYKSEMIKEIRRETSNILTIKDETGKAKLSGEKNSPYKLQYTTQ